MKNLLVKKELNENFFLTNVSKLADQKKLKTNRHDKRGIRELIKKIMPEKAPKSL